MSGQVMMKKAFLAIVVASSAYVSVVTKEPSIAVIAVGVSAYFWLRKAKVAAPDVDRVGDVAAARASMRAALAARRAEHLATERQHLRDVALVSGAAAAAGLDEVEEDSLTNPIYGQVGLGITDLY